MTEKLEKSLNILVLSLDQSADDTTSAAGKRILEYSALVGEGGKYTVLIPAMNDAKKSNDRMNRKTFSAFAKVRAFFRLYRQAAKKLSEVVYTKSDRTEGDRAGRYDLISVQDVYFVGWMALRLARKYNTALEVQVHGFEKLTQLRRMLARHVLAHADGVRTVSKRLERVLIEDFLVRQDRITIVPIYVENDSDNNSKILAESRSSLDLQKISLETSQKVVEKVQKKLPQKKPDDFVFLTVSRLVPVKNISLQLRAFYALLLNHKNSNASHKNASMKPHLWIVGDGPERQALEMECLRLGLRVGFSSDDEVTFFGYREPVELIELYRMADVFLLTSESEGWGMSVVEAARQSLPIIMTDVGCAGELIVNDISGIVIIGLDSRHEQFVAKLSEAMIRLSMDAVLRERLGKAAFQAIQNLPSKEATFALYRHGWENAIRQQSRASESQPSEMRT
jgi:glycosyltransferase involved in cell wall biosynthesis